MTDETTPPSPDTPTENPSLEEAPAQPERIRQLAEPNDDPTAPVISSDAPSRGQKLPPAPKSKTPKKPRSSTGDGVTINP